MSETADLSPPTPPPALKMMLRICLVIGGALVVGALILAAYEWRFIATSEHAVATVSRIDREWMSGSSGSNGSRNGGNWGYRVVATFTASDGRPAEARSGSLTSYTGYRVGDRIGVDYPPGQPERAQLVRFVDRWMLALVLGGIGAVVLAIGGFAIWLLRQPGTRITTNGMGGFGIRSPVYTVEASAPSPAVMPASSTAPPRRRNWTLVAVVLGLGIAIGLMVARLGHRDAAPAPAKPGYPSNLTVKAPAMPDPGATADAGWTAPGNGGDTPADLTMAARAFVAQPAQDAAMQAALRAQVGALGIDCPAIVFAPGETLLLAAPAPSFDGGGALQRGMLRQRFIASGCPGRSAEFNIWIVAAGDGAPVRTIAGLPGTTRADPRLQQDATPIVLGIAARLAPGCTTVVISDTHLAATVAAVPALPWTEDWLVTGCGRRVALTVRFVPDAATGMTRIEVPSDRARLLSGA